MKTIIIGAVAAGMSAASKIRRTQYEAEVTVYERGGVVSYGACGLPYFVGQEIPDANKMIIRTKEQFEKMGITMRLFHEVMGVDVKKKVVLVKDLSTGRIFEDGYDHLLIATGASPVVPPWEGVTHPVVKTLSTIEDGEAIKELAKKRDVRNVVVIGAGFIGVELVEAFVGLEKKTTLIEYKNQVLPHFDKEMAYELQLEMERKNVLVRTNEKVVSLERISEDAVFVHTDKNQYLADLVIVSVGVKPNTAFLDGSGIKRLDNGAILVDQEMRTSVKDVYAAGDCATVYHRVKETMDEYIPLGTNANKQGKIVGAIISGEKGSFQSALGTSMIKVCDMEGAKTGLSEREAILGNVDYKAVTVKALNHASYYPDPKPITMKLLIQTKTRALIGAQAVGYEGTALRINTLALAIHTKTTVDELAWVDFGYAPPFSGVWDVIHIASNAMK